MSSLPYVKLIGHHYWTGIDVFFVEKSQLWEVSKYMKDTAIKNDIDIKEEKNTFIEFNFLNIFLGMQSL